MCLSCSFTWWATPILTAPAHPFWKAGIHPWQQSSCVSSLTKSLLLLKQHSFVTTYGALDALFIKVIVKLCAHRYPYDFSFFS